MATIEELKEIIVRLNTTVLRQEDVINELQRENEHLQESVDALSAPSQMPAPKPKCLENSEFDYIIERALGLHLPPDQSLALSRDEVFKIEEEFQLCVDAISNYESCIDRLVKANEEQENETEKYHELWDTEKKRANYLEGALQERAKKTGEMGIITDTMQE